MSLPVLYPLYRHYLDRLLQRATTEQHSASYQGGRYRREHNRDDYQFSMTDTYASGDVARGGGRSIERTHGPLRPA